MAKNKTTPNGGLQWQGRGALCEIKSTVRQMRLYPLTRHEVDTIAMFNGLVPLFFSVASSLVSFAIGLYVQACISPPPESQSKFINAIIWIPGVSGLLVFVLAIVLAVTKRGTARKIMDTVTDETNDDQSGNQATNSA